MFIYLLGGGGEGVTQTISSSTARLQKLTVTHLAGVPQVDDGRGLWRVRHVSVLRSEIL
jgi:hypothetical protein